MPPCFDAQVITSYFKSFDSTAFKGDATAVIQPFEIFNIYRVKPSRAIIHINLFVLFSNIINTGLVAYIEVL